MFIDEAVVELVAGSGGNGCLALEEKNMLLWADLLVEMVVKVLILSSK